jgi:flagellar export protein FliJ
MPALPPYRLQALLTIRERAKEAAEHALGAAIAAKKVEEEKLKALELELSRMVESRHQYRREYMEKAMKGEMAAQGAVTVNHYIEHLKGLEKLKQEAIVDQKEVIEAREQDVKAARAELLKKTQELKALEKHREKWIEEIKKERATKEELEMDELAQTIFLRQNR